MSYGGYDAMHASPIQPLGRARTRILDAVMCASRVLLDDRAQVADSGNYRMQLKQTIMGTVLEIERQVHQESLPTEQVVYPIRLEVPWRVQMPVEVPRGFWRKLFNIPAQEIVVTAEGIVDTEASIVVEAQHFAAYPDMPPAPITWGAPVRLTEHHVPQGRIRADNRDAVALDIQAERCRSTKEDE